MKLIRISLIIGALGVDTQRLRFTITRNGEMIERI